MGISLKKTLDLVGRLDDTPGDDTPRERFRRFLSDDVSEVGQVRDHIEECLRASGEQYSRALQDLVNHLGRFLGFEVTSGRYQGAQGHTGFDGHWRSAAAGFHIVVEVKTTEVYAVKTTTLAGYVNDLISEKVIPNWEQALGLYVVGRPDPQIKQLENAIIAEKRTDQLRVISVESLLALAEMMAQYDVRDEDVLTVLRPSGPTIDPIVSLMERIVVGAKSDEGAVDQGLVPPPKRGHQAQETIRTGDMCFWLAPVRSDKTESAEGCVERLVGTEHAFAIGPHTAGRKRLKAGDWMCFYAVGKGVVAHAKVTSAAENRRHPGVRHPDEHPWVFTLSDVQLYLDSPVVLDEAARAQLDAFAARDPGGPWAWFVQGMKSLNEDDFRLLTRQS